MKKEVISTEKAPGAVGPYSQGIRVGSLLYTAGQIALDPKTGKMVERDIAIQTKRVLLNLQGILEAAGANLDQVIKTTVFLQDMANFGAMNEVYEQFFLGIPHYILAKIDF